MLNSLKDQLHGISRRGLFRQGGLLAATGLLTKTGAAAPVTKTGGTVYDAIGVRPLINARGTYTIISGSQSLPEVKAAMLEASKHYVNLDELMEGVSARLAELTKAEWGIVTAGCAAALTHATAACIAGADPEKMQRLPDLTGLKNEVIMPRHSRNVYDHAVRTLGVKIIEVDTAEQLQAAFNPRTAMVLVLASPAADQGPLSTENVARVAKSHGVPLIVDAAAETLTTPSKHLLRGATMVAYSGGKCMRGPQAAGLLLGPKNLLKAAWLNSAPHHAFGRALKVGKEEIMGMLAAVEMWQKRDHDAEWKRWELWNGEIASSVTKIPGVTTEIHQPEDLSNHAPMLEVKWDGAALGITGREVEKILFNGNPRITIGGASGTRPENMRSSVTVMPYMMMPGDSKIVADALYAVMSKPPQITAPAAPSGTPSDIDGQWNVHLEFVSGSASHSLTFEQKDNMLRGTHRGDVLSGDLQGSVHGNQVSFRSDHKIQGTSLGYDFKGTVDGNAMHGTVVMGEYGEARWSATRHKYA
jgi:D-glucosaminate-6-phosphate ammonia-lyase